MREGCGGRRSRHCPERSEGIAEAKAEPVAARPERQRGARPNKNKKKNSILKTQNPKFKIKN